MPPPSATRRQTSATGSAVAAIARRAAEREPQADQRDADAQQSMHGPVQPRGRPRGHADAVAPEHAEQHRAHDGTQGNLRAVRRRPARAAAPWRVPPRRARSRRARRAPPGAPRTGPERTPGSSVPTTTATGGRSTGRRARAALGEHALVELGDRLAAGAHEQERQHAVHQAREAGQHHAGAEYDRACRSARRSSPRRERGVR